MFKTNRHSEYPILDVILNRWSPRAFSPEPLTHDEFMTLFEAARWAENSFNNQPWRFLYAIRDSEYWPTFLGLLNPGNAIWAQNAYALLVVLSKKTFDYDGRPSITHSFDTGAAAQNLAIQGESMNIAVHGMEGFDYERARCELKVPDVYAVEAMFAVGKMGNKDELPESLREREKPSDRKPIKDFVFEGMFPHKT